MKTFLFSSLLILSIFILGAFGGDENSDYPSGSPAGYTGSPGDGHNCTSCHNGSASTVTGWITSDVPADGYTPGNTYTITVTVTGSGQKGFEVSPQNVSGTLLGTITAGTNNHLVGSGKYVTQNAKSGANPATWSFSWTAPAAGTGLVTFYGAFTVTKPVTKLSTLDVIEYTPPAPLEVIAYATPSLICSGESSQLYAVASGGNGNYTFSWTSIPPGFTSNIVNPVVQPIQTTQYIVVVNDGVTTNADTVEVTVNQYPAAFAGNDTTYNLNVSQIQLQGIATNYSTVLWTTAGDGSFNNPGILDAIYSPGTGDRTNGSVNLTLTASPVAPCSSGVYDVIHILLESGTGLNDLNSVISITISPNPTQGIFTISFHGSIKTPVEIVITDIQGRIMMQERQPVTDGMSKSMNITGLPEGIYFLKVLSDSGTVTGKIILD